MRGDQIRRRRLSASALIPTPASARTAAMSSDAARPARETPEPVTGSVITPRGGPELGPVEAPRTPDSGVWVDVPVGVGLVSVAVKVAVAPPSALVAVAVGVAVLVASCVPVGWGVV